VFIFLKINNKVIDKVIKGKNIPSPNSRRGIKK